MDQQSLTHQARCLVILAGGVLERSVEDRARQLAASRSSVEITPEDVRKAITEYLTQELSNLPNLIEAAIEKHWEGLTKAA